MVVKLLRSILCFFIFVKFGIWVNRLNRMRQTDDQLVLAQRNTFSALLTKVYLQ